MFKHEKVKLGYNSELSDSYLFEYEIDRKGLDFRCVGTISDVHGILAKVERDYRFEHTTMLDITRDMKDLLLQAKDTSYRILMMQEDNTGYNPYNNNTGPVVNKRIKNEHDANKALTTEAKK